MVGLVSTFDVPKSGKLKSEWSVDTLGGKGLGLLKMTAAGINVPPAFIFGTQWCREYMDKPAQTMGRVHAVLATEVIPGLTKHFGYTPLVSVRSGAKFSMPGMMDTILNVGLCSETREEWSQRIGAECTDNSWGRLVEMYADVVHGIPRSKFEGANEPHDFGERYKQAVGEYFPGVTAQLLGAIEAVFKSWNNERAKSYRKLNNISDDLGTAVIVQAMVFGNSGHKSCTGVLFSRHPATGAPGITGEFLVNAQGEDVVAGNVTPDPLAVMEDWNPKVYKKLKAVVEKLELANRDMQDVEFTVENGKLYILQTRNGKRTAQAALRIAVDLMKEKVITAEDAVMRVSYQQVLNASRSVIDPEFKKDTPATAKGLAASNGCVTGIAVFSAADAVAAKDPCILIAKETTPDDIEGMNAAVGILTSTGGATSHAAVVARGMDKVCVVGCTELTVMEGGAELSDGHGGVMEIYPGDKVTLDGATGEVWVGMDVPMTGEASQYVDEFLSMVEEYYKVYRVFTEPPEAGTKSKRMLIATYLAGREAISVVEVENAFLKMLSMVPLDADIVVDLRDYATMMEDYGDDEVENLLGGELPSTVNAQTKVGVLVRLKKSGGALFPKKFAVLELGLGTIETNQLKSVGITTIPVVQSLAQLRATTGVCVVAKALYENFEVDDVKKVLAEKKAKGERVVSFNIVSDAPLHKGAAPGALFAVSRINMMQSWLS